MSLTSEDREWLDNRFDNVYGRIDLLRADFTAHLVNENPHPAAKGNGRTAKIIGLALAIVAAVLFAAAKAEGWL
jgi:hypothetical protein